LKDGGCAARAPSGGVKNTKGAPDPLPAGISQLDEYLVQATVEPHLDPVLIGTEAVPRHVFEH
jgi:hypothetical protein